MWNRLRVSTRLYVAFGALFLLILLLFALNHWTQRQGDRTLRTVVEIEFERARQVADWQRASSVAAQKIIALNRSNDPALGALFGPTIGGEVQDVVAQQQAILAWATNPKQTQITDAISGLSARLRESSKKIAELKAAEDLAAAAQEFDRNFLPAVTAYIAKVHEFGKLHHELVNADIQAQQTQEQRTELAVMISLALVALVVAGSAHVLVRYVVKSLNAAVDVAQAVAAGNLSFVHQSGTGGYDEFSGLMDSLSSMVGSLRELVSRVRGAAQNLATASREAADSHRDMSHRAELLAETLQHTAATMEQLSAAIQHTADNAKEADRHAARTGKIADDGAAAVDRVVQAMQAIEESSSKVERMLEEIDALAFQTNILSLNAGVEAARAGDHGNGFAVVASEVRNLAQRSAGVAKQIRGVIQESANNVRGGASEAQTAGRTMAEARQAMEQVLKLIAGISASTNEQSAGIGDMGNAIVQLETSAQQESAMMESTATAALSLQEQAEELAASVTAFTMSDRTGPSPSNYVRTVPLSPGNKA